MTVKFEDAFQNSFIPVLILCHRYNKTISVSELHKISDTIEIREQGGAGRMVYLLPSSERTPSPEEGTDMEVQFLHSKKLNVLEHFGVKVFFIPPQTVYGGGGGGYTVLKLNVLEHFGVKVFFCFRGFNRSGPSCSKHR